MPIYEDKAGNIWFGTGGGVSRYDGKSFRNFTTTDGLTNNDVHAIVQDKTGKFGLAQGVISSFMMEKHLPLLPIKTAKLSGTFGL